MQQVEPQTWAKRRSLTLVSSACLALNLLFLAVFTLPSSEFRMEPWPRPSHKWIAGGVLVLADVAVAVGEGRGWLPVWPSVVAALNVAVTMLALVLAVAVAVGLLQ